MHLLSFSLAAVERGLVPDKITRAAIRRLCQQRLRDCDRGNDVANERALLAFVEWMRTGPIAPVSEKANEQHYDSIQGAMLSGRKAAQALIADISVMH